MDELKRQTLHGVTLLGRKSPGGVTLAFTERTGGVSAPPYASLNLGTHVGDRLKDVLENRRRVLKALDIEQLSGRLLVPHQIHSDMVYVVNGTTPLEQARSEIAQGCDAIVCTQQDVPVLLVFADCVPVIIEATSGFAVVHSGWKGTLARISQKAAKLLIQETTEDPASFKAYLGPHILGEDYQVSEDLLARFTHEFGSIVAADATHLDLSAAIKASLVDAGLAAHNIVDLGLSTPWLCERFYSYRNEEGTCGRHGAIACLPSEVL